MGFPLVCYCLPIPKPVIAFCKLLSAIREAVLLILAILGLCSFPQPDAAASRGAADAAHKPEEVKSRLPAVEFAQLLAEQQQQQPASSPTGTGTHAECACRDDHEEGGGEDDAAAACIVCLEALEAADEVRRLGNCAHAFHRACIDRWIDLGRATCPLCRSDLLPRPRRRAALGRLARRLTARVW